jgi:hypothetical protein
MPLIACQPDALGGLAEAKVRSAPISASINYLSPVQASIGLKMARTEYPLI